jgi:hypothetical protein
MTFVRGHGSSSGRWAGSSTGEQRGAQQGRRLGCSKAAPVTLKAAPTGGDTAMTTNESSGVRHETGHPQRGEMSDMRWANSAVLGRRHSHGGPRGALARGGPVMFARGCSRSSG